MTPPDGLYSSDHYPPEMPELTNPPKPKPEWAKDVPGALTREQYLAIGRPILLLAGHLKDVQPEDAKPVLPPMPNTKVTRKRGPRMAGTPPATKPPADDVPPF